MPEELKGTTIVLDSPTAERIAHEYITYKYIDSAMGFVCAVLMVALVAYVIHRFIKSNEL